MPQAIRNIYFIFGMFFCSYEQDTDKYPRRQVPQGGLLQNSGGQSSNSVKQGGISRKQQRKLKTFSKK